MGKKTYIGVSNVARKVKKAYIGVDGKARKIKKMYIGDANGKARLFFSGGELAYYNATSLHCKKYQQEAVSNTKYALFAGGDGEHQSGQWSEVYAFDASLVGTKPTNMSYGRRLFGTTAIGKYAIMAGGQATSGGELRSVEAYDDSLTRKDLTSLQTNCASIMATTVGNYALFAGGLYYTYDDDGDEWEEVVRKVETFNTSLTKGTATNLSQGRYDGSAITIGDYALFGGGASSSYNNIVDTYNSSLTKGTASNLSVGRSNGMGVAVAGNYALFAGGYNGGSSNGGQGNKAVVDAYNKSLTKSVATSLTVAIQALGATSLGEFAIFGGGGINGQTVYNVVHIYDASLTQTLSTLSQARYMLKATSIGDYALFGGGYLYDTSTKTYGGSKVVDVFTIG